MLATRKLLPGASSWSVAAAGLLFAVHPIHTEAVSSIVGRAEILSGLFFLLAFLVYTMALTDPLNGVWSKAKVGWSLAAAGAAVLCKEQGVTVIALMIAYDFAIVNNLTLPMLFTVLLNPKKTLNDPQNSSRPVKQSPSKQSQKHSHWPPPFRAFVARVSVILLGFIVIMWLRLRMNSVEIISDEKTNRTR